MKRKKPFTPASDLEELIPILIMEWRKLHRLPPGPLHALQTREFRSLVAAVIRHQKEKDDSDKELLGAYLLYDWILHYQQGLNLIQELPHTPRRVLDLFSRSAPFALASLRSGSLEVVALDPSLPALKIGTEVCGKFGYPISIRQHDCLDLNFPIAGKWDLIIVGHALLRALDSTEQQAGYIRSLLQRLSENGHLLLVESSVLQDNRQFLTLRDTLVREGAIIAAPCIWKGSCPALQHASSPCFAQRKFEKPFLIKEIQRAAQINLSSLKMSYLILKCPATGWPRLEEKDLYRVISPPIDTFRGKRYFLCGTDGKKTLGTRLQEHPKQSRAYEYLQRGDLISIKNPLSVKDDFEITPDTEIKLEAPCGKPVPEIDEDLLYKMNDGLNC